MSDSQTLKNIIEHLINNRKIKNESEFCSKTGFQTATLSKIKKGVRNIPSSLKLSMMEIFDISPEYLSKGILPIVKYVPQKSEAEVNTEIFDPPESAKDEFIGILNKINATLMDQLDRANKDNDAQKETIKELQNTVKIQYIQITQALDKIEKKLTPVRK